MNKSNAILGTIIIVLILCMGFMKGCDRTAPNDDNEVITSITEVTDTVRNTVTISDTNWIEHKVVVQVPDSMLVPVYYDVATGNDYKGMSMIYNDMVKVDSTEVYYFIEWTEKGIEALSFDVRTNVPYIRDTILDTILVTNTVQIESITTAKKRVRLMGGGSLGYSFITKQPIIAPLIGLKDKQDRFYYVTCDILTQGVAVGIAVPLTR